LKRIEPKPLIGFLLNPFGSHACSIDYENGVVSINARRKQNIQVADLYRLDMEPLRMPA